MNIPRRTLVETLVVVAIILILSMDTFAPFFSPRVHAGNVVYTASKLGGEPGTVANILMGSEPNGVSGIGAPSTAPTLLIDNRVITPAGRQTWLGDLPLNAILSPDGNYLLVANSGAGVQSLQVISVGTGQVIQTIPYVSPASVFVGLAYSPDGTHAYAAGGGSDVLHVFNVNPFNGKLQPLTDITLGTLAQNPFPTGLSVSPDGSKVYVANNLANNVTVVDTTSDSVAGVIPVGSYPYTTLASSDGKTVYVSNWGDSTVSVIDVAQRKVTATIHVGNHPSAMVFGPNGLLFVADSNSDAVSVINTATNQELRRISLAPYPNAPLSSSPEGLAISPDGKYLYVADSGENAIVVIALNGLPGPETVLGRIPTGWYPTAVAVSSDGQTLFVTNAKGQGAGPNAGGYDPNPTRQTVPFIDAVDGFVDGYCQCTRDRTTYSMIVGTLSTIAVPTSGQLQLYTEQVKRNNHYGDSSVNERSANNPIPLPGNSSPIKHVIYIIKENRTYDQVFGDLPLGDNDPALTLFPRAVTPNLHALAERFGILDNFYTDAEVSADGHNWSMAANASDYTQKMWPQAYSAGVGRNRAYDFEGSSAISLAPGGYIWDAAAEAHISYRDYGEFYTFGGAPKLIPTNQADMCTGPVAFRTYTDPKTFTRVSVPADEVACYPVSGVNDKITPNLVDHYDPRFRTYELGYSDLDRVAEWKREFDQFVAHDNLPQLEIIRLPNDHTAGTRPGYPTPQSLVAENDAAVGQLVDIVSHSKYWATTAIFIVEDDAQNGPDHVDAHRTEALVISPYTSHSSPTVDHTLYDTAAMLRTIELILNLRPLSQYDANAMPMWRSFSSTPDLTPYTALDPSVPIVNNSSHAYGAEWSKHLDFSREDRASMADLNHILWHAIKGISAPYPETHSIYQASHPSSEDF
jgi:YVTN family beta-propeller protein